MRAFVFSSDKTAWALQAFAHQHNKYMNGWPATVWGFTPPTFPLPGNFDFRSIGPFSDYPVDKWSNSLIKAAEQTPEEIFLWTMDDFWLCRHADIQALFLLEQYMVDHPEVARIDLTTDRLYAANMYDYKSLGRLDLIASSLPVPYLLSFQAGIWRKSALLKYLIPDETPWQVEMEGTTRMNNDRALVLGTRQAPLRYLNAVQKGRLATDGGYQGHVPFTVADWEDLKNRGYLNVPAEA